MKWLRFFIFSLLMQLCSCGGGSNEVLRIGLDPDWYPIDFGKQTSYVNGYTEELLVEMARYSGIHFELIKTNWDTLLEGLRKGQYDAVITTLAPYEYNRAKYDFSSDILSIGPVLIVPYKAKKGDLAKMKGDIIGILANDPAALVLEKYPTLVIRSYPSIPELLNAVAKGEIEGALLEQIPASNYISDLYANVLRVASQPLNSNGIRFVGPKGRLEKLHRTIEALRKKKTIDSLQKKWDLSPL